MIKTDRLETDWVTLWRDAADKRQTGNKPSGCFEATSEHQEPLLTAKEAEKPPNASPAAQSLLYSALNVLLEINFCDKKLSY